MATSTLFGYTIEEQDGKLVITVHGAFAEAAIGQLRDELTSGRGLKVISRLSPIPPLGRLLRTKRYEAEAAAREVAAGAAEEQELSTDQLLSQGVDENLGTFEQQIAEFKKSLAEIKSELKPAAGAAVAQAAGAKKKE
jgi:hypothetical protein